MSYYKLYHIVNGKLRSNYGTPNEITIGKPYSAEEGLPPLSLTALDLITEWLEHGNVVCDVEPLSEVIDYGDEAECQKIIVTNPRYVLSPDFLSLLFDNNCFSCLQELITESDLDNSIELFNNDNTCDGIPLSFSINDSLDLFLLRESNNKKIQELLDLRRAEFNYKSILKTAIKKHVGITAISIIVDSWNKNHPDKRSKRWRKILSFAGVLRIPTRP